MKKNLYLLLCVLLGVLVTTVLHGVAENIYIELLIRDFETWSFGLTWKHWYTIHTLTTVLLLLVGVVGGWFVGLQWWKRVYGIRCK